MNAHTTQLTATRKWMVVCLLGLGMVIAYVDRANLSVGAIDIQRELPGTVLLEVGYAGSHGLKFSENRMLNQLPDAALALGNALRDQVQNPFFGKIASGILSKPTVSRAQLLRPFPQFDNVTSVNADWASSIYHALEAKVEKRYAEGLTITGSYTYSKLIDYGIGAFAGESLPSGGGFQNWSNLRAERSVSLLDQTHRFIVNTVYELPFGKDLRGAAKWMGGWEVGAILSLFSGGPIGITSAANNTFAQGGGQRPNWNGLNPKESNPTPDRWINPAPFSNPPPFTFGNAGRTLSGLRSQGTKELDVSMHKNTNLTETLRLQFRAEFFNITNTPQFAPPNSTFGSSQFGVVSAQGNMPRIIQFALKLVM